MNFEIRNYSEKDFQTVRDWTASQHWNPGIFDYLAFQTIDKQGFWVGVLDGQPIASVAAVQYDQNFAYVGLYFVKSQYRGKGYGLQVWKKGLSRLTAKNIGLQATPDQQRNYMKFGFQPYHKILRYEFYGTGQQFTSSKLINCKQMLFQNLTNYDQKCFPVKRNIFLKKWIELPQSKALAFVEQGQVKGYGVLRVADQGYTIGPLYANQFEVAHKLLKGLAGSVNTNKKIFIDVPDINFDALKLVEDWKMQADLVYTRMYTNGQPQIPMSKKVYGITSCEFG